MRGSMTVQKIFKTILVFLGRVFLGSIFIFEGLKKLLNWEDSDRMFVSALSDWQFHAGFSPALQDFIGFILPWTPLPLIAASLLEIGGGLCIVLGKREKLGAWLLILVLIPASVIFHAFWFLDGSQRELESSIFFKNLTICGSLFLVAALGAQAKAGDSEGSMEFS